MEDRSDLVGGEESDAGPTQVIALSGEIDLTVVPEIHARLIEALGAGARLLIVDCVAVTFMDSSGLGALVSAQRRAQEVGAAISIVVEPGHVRREFEVTGLGAVFGLYPSVGEALAGRGTRELL